MLSHQDFPLLSRSKAWYAGVWEEAETLRTVTMKIMGAFGKPSWNLGRYVVIWWKRQGNWSQEEWGWNPGSSCVTPDK